jgi:hypothetical protein
VHCNNLFEQKDKRQKFCSEKCRYNYNDNKKKLIKEIAWKKETMCSFCKINFIPTHKGKSFCCRENMLKYHSNINAEKKKQITRVNKLNSNKIKYQKCRCICKDIVRNLLGKEKRYLPSKIILGYTKEEFCQHIENLFEDGMTWENHGTVWQVDHIRPIASFLLSKDDIEHNIEVTKKCNDLKNLRPLFSKENNIKKSWYLGYLWSKGYPISYKDNNGKIKKLNTNESNTLRDFIIMGNCI